MSESYSYSTNDNERAAKIATQKRLFWRCLYLALGLLVVASLLSAPRLYFTITDPPPIIIEKEIEKAEEPQLTAYYADYIEKFGMLIGILPLTDEQVQHRSSSIRIKSKGGITNEVAYVNSRGKLTSPGNSEYVNRFPLVKYEYSTKYPNKFPNAECYDEKENLLLRQKTDSIPDEDGMFIIEFERIPTKTTSKKNISNNEHSGKEMGENQNAIPFSQEPNYKKTAGKPLNRPEGNPTQMAYDKLKEGWTVTLPTSTASSTVTKFRVGYTPGGEEQVVFYYRDKEPIKDLDETFGREYQYNEEGRIREIVCLNEKGEPMNCSFGWAKKNYEYDDTNDRLGNFKSVQWRDTDNQYVLGELKICRFEADFDQWGNHREERYYKPSPQEPHYEPSSEGVWSAAIRKFEYNEGNSTKLSYFGINEEPLAVSGDDPFDSWEKTYYENDKIATQTWYYNVKPHPDGYRKRVNTYDEYDNCTKIECFGEDGNRCLSNEGIAGWDSEYEGNNETKRSFFGVNGEAVAVSGDDPYDSWEKTYHENDKIAMWTWFYNVKPHPNGYQKWVNTYNEDEKLIKVNFFGEDGNPNVSDSDNTYDSWEATYHENGKIATQTWYYNVKPHPNGYRKGVNTYNENEKRIKVEYFGEDGNRCLIDEGIAGWNSEYEGNNETKRSFFGINDEPIILVGDDPYDSWEKTYHENGKIATWTWFYNVKPHPDGYRKQVWIYDEDGNRIKEELFDEEGKNL